MKRPERLKLVEKIRAHLNPRRSHWTDEAVSTKLLSQAADCIVSLEKELDAIHENFLKDER